MLKLYKYLYYRLYSWNLRTWGESDFPQYNAMYGVSFMMFLNLCLIGSILQFLGLNIFLEDKLPIIVIIIVLVCIVLINYFLFIHNGRYKNLAQKYKKEDLKKRRLNTLILWLYTFLSFALFVLSIKLFKEFNNIRLSLKDMHTFKTDTIYRPLAILVVSVVIGTLYYIFGYKKPVFPHSNINRPEDIKKPIKPVKNDKLIKIKNLKPDYAKQVIDQFCNIYNQEQIIVRPCLSVIKNEMIITFPYNISFVHFCFCINYILYADELCLLPDYQPEITGWCSTSGADKWMTPELLNKKVMLFIPEWDAEHDNIYLTTMDNIGFKIGFADGKQPKRLAKPILEFTEHSIDLSTINLNEGISFK